MEFLTPSTNRAEALTVTPTDPRCAAIAARFGNAEKFMKAWSPANLSGIAERADLCISSGVPSLVLMMKTYGSEVIAGNLTIFVAAAFARMGETQLDINDAANVAQMICENKDFRTLNFALVVNFFAELQQGKWETYSGKPVQILRAFNQYAKTAFDRQNKLKDADEAKRRREAEAEAQRNAITWEAFAQKHGIAGASPLEQLQNI